MIILAPSLGFIVKSFDPGRLNIVSRVASYNDKKTQVCDSGNKEKARIKLLTTLTYRYTVGELYLTRSRLKNLMSDFIKLKKAKNILIIIK